MKQCFFSFDVMLDGRLFCSLHYPLRSKDENIDIARLSAWIEQRLPTLRGKDYKICPVLL